MKRNFSCNLIVNLDESFYCYEIPSFIKLFENLYDIKRVETKKWLKVLNYPLELKFRYLTRITKFLFFEILFDGRNILSVEILSKSDNQIGRFQRKVLRRFHHFLLMKLCKLVKNEKDFYLVTKSGQFIIKKVFKMQIE